MYHQTASSFQQDNPLSASALYMSALAQCKLAQALYMSAPEPYMYSRYMSERMMNIQQNRLADMIHQTALLSRMGTAQIHMC